MSQLTKEMPPEDLAEGGPQAMMEKALLEKYLRRKGYRLSDLDDLPEEKAKELMTAASRYASLTLATMESTAHFREAIHRPG